MGRRGKGLRAALPIALFGVGVAAAALGMWYVMRPEPPLEHQGPFRAYLDSLRVTRPVGVNLGRELVPGTLLRPHPDGTFSVEAWTDRTSYARPDELRPRSSQCLTDATFLDAVSFESDSSLSVPGLEADSLRSSLRARGASHVLTVVALVESRTLSATEIWSAGLLEPHASRVKSGELVIVAQTVHAKRLFYSFGKSSEWNAATRAKVVGGDAAVTASGQMASNGSMRFDDFAVGFQKVAVALPDSEALRDPEDRAALVADMNRAGVPTEEAGNPVLAVVAPDQIPAASELSRITAGHLGERRDLGLEVQRRGLLIESAEKSLAERDGRLAELDRQTEALTARLAERAAAMEALAASAEEARSAAAEKEARLEALEGELARTTQEVEVLRSHVKKLEGGVAMGDPELAKALEAAGELRTLLATKDKELASLERRKATLEASLACRERELAALREEVEKARGDAAAAKERIARLAQELAARDAGAAEWGRLRASLVAKRRDAGLALRDAITSVLRLTDQRLDPGATDDRLLTVLPKRTPLDAGATTDILLGLLRFARAQATLTALSEVQ